MKPVVPATSKAAALRRKAEAALASRPAGPPRTPADNARLLHELQVHQIELELQQEELIAQRAEVESGLARYTDLYDFAPIAYATLADDGTITQSNLACASLLGVKRALLQERRLGQFVAVADRRAFSTWLDGVFTGTGKQRCQLRLSPRNAAEDANGEVRTVHVDAKLCADGLLCRAVLTDMTEQAVAEGELRAVEAQLRESQKMEAVGTLASGIAHDFNNILGAILGNLALARQDVGADHPALLPLAQIQQVSVRARTLVQQILSFSHRQLQPAIRLALQTPVKESIALLRATLPAGVRLNSSLASKPLVVLADATQYQQVVMNLCTNAWQAFAGAGGQIDILLDAVSLGPGSQPPCPAKLAPGRYARLQVRDDGCGMDDATRSRAFEPFFTTKTVGHGTGLGLAVVKGIVSTHGGAITVDSHPGLGCSFDVFLPLVDGKADATDAPTVADQPQATDRRCCQVAYVDDDIVILVMVQQLLERRGYGVKAFDDSTVALAELLAAPQAFDLVITDYNMPGLSGLALAEAVLAVRPELPIIISSGYVTEQLRIDAKRCGVREVLHKENTVEQLGALVQRLLAELPE